MTKLVPWAVAICALVIWFGGIELTMERLLAMVFVLALAIILHRVDHFEERRKREKEERGKSERS